MAVLGFGQRGIVFSNVAKSYPDEIKLVAVIEKNTDKYDLIKREYHLDNQSIFSDYDAFYL